MRRAFVLTLTSDAVFSARAATLGGHEGLSYIPGAALLGWAARQLYANLNSSAYTVFHSGKVRFSNGLPLIKNGQSGKVAYPVPQVLMEKKHTRDGVRKEKINDVKKEWLDPEKLRVHPKKFEEEGKKPPPQPEALKNIYVAPDGEVHKPDPGYRMKTAIEAGRAAEAELFGYQYLKAGSRFIATIEADGAIPEDVLQLFDNKTILLGRSRRSEFGEVFCESAENLKGDIWPSTHGQPSAEGIVTVWLLSDLAVDDENGAPSLAPELHVFDLREESKLARKDSVKLVPHESAIATRRYAPFNGYLRRPELERSVLAAGSVLRYELPEDFDASGLKYKSIVGLYREAGLGRVWINPPLLSKLDEEKCLPDGKDAVTVALPSGQPPKVGAKADPAYADNLIAWAKAQRAETELEETCDRLVGEWFAEIKQLYHSARNISGDVEAGPGSSQWGRIKGICNNTQLDLRKLKSRLLTDENAICRGEDWETEGQLTVKPDETKTLSFRAWIAEKLADPFWQAEGKLLAFQRTLGKLADRVRGEIVKSDSHGN